MVSLLSCGSDAAPPRCSGLVIVVSAEKGDAKPVAHVLSQAGFGADVADAGDRDLAALVKKADLVVVCGKPGSPNRWSKEHFEILEGKKVLAVGPSGAKFLGLGGLLIGDPHGWIDQGLPKRVRVSSQLGDSAFKNILKEPYPIPASAFTSPEGILTLITDGSGGPTSTAIYDGGSFPKGTLGIGLEESDHHHWLIAKQGNYVLWGAGIHDRSLTPEGRALFLNLCTALIAAASEEVVFPEKKFLKLGEHAGTLKGGYRDIYYVTPPGSGTLRATLKWKRTHDMTLMTDIDRVDGKSPLSTKWELSSSDLGKALRIEVCSFDLKDGEETPYTLTLTGP